MFTVKRQQLALERVFGAVSFDSMEDGRVVASANGYLKIAGERAPLTFIGDDEEGAVRGLFSQAARFCAARPEGQKPRAKWNAPRETAVYNGAGQRVRYDRNSKAFVFAIWQ